MISQCYYVLYYYSYIISFPLPHILYHVNLLLQITLLLKVLYKNEIKLVAIGRDNNEVKHGSFLSLLSCRYYVRSIINFGFKAMAWLGGESGTYVPCMQVREVEKLLNQWEEKGKNILYL